MARATAEAENKDLSAQKERLTSERLRLLQAHYAGAIPIDLLKVEQDRIARQLAGMEQRLTATALSFDRFEATLHKALDCAVNCARGYHQASHQERRLFNQAFFTHIYLDEDTIRAELAEPFKTLLGSEMAGAARQHTAARSGMPTPGDVLGREHENLRTVPQV